MELIEASPAQAAALQDNARQMQAYWAQSVLPALARRWAFWEVIRDAGKAYGIAPEMAVGPALAKANATLDGAAVAAVRMMSALSDQSAVIQPWSLETERGDVLYMAIVSNEPANLGGWWLVVPSILKGVGVAAAGIAGIILADGWQEGQRMAAESEATLRATQAKLAEAAAQAAKLDPDAAAAIAGVIDRANRMAAGPAGAVDRLLNAVGAVGEGIERTAKTATDWLPLVALFLLARGKLL